MKPSVRLLICRWLVGLLDGWIVGRLVDLLVGWSVRWSFIISYKGREVTLPCPQSENLLQIISGPFQSIAPELQMRVMRRGTVTTHISR